MKYDRRTKRFRGFAVIKFEAIESAQKAVEETNLYRIKGKRISINFNKQRQTKGKKSDKTGDETCWFCYNNKDIERHLIIKTGKELYIALPKGPVVDHHFLIIPRNHIQSMIHLESSAQSELNYLK